MASFRLITFGCKVNQCDSQVIRETLISWGMTPCDPVPGGAQEPSHPDLVVMNSCTVTGVADSKFRKALRRTRREHPDAFIGVTGCFTNKPDASAEDLPEADLIFETGDFETPAEALRELGVIPMMPMIPMMPQNSDAAIHGQSYFAEHTRAFLKIQDGCDCFCSYCIVPTVRANFWSESPDNIVAAMNDLAAKGYREVVLTGIHLGFYGRGEGSDGGRDGGLLGLLRKIEAECGIERVRISSIEVNEVSDEMIDLIAGSEKLCPHLHLPLQSGSDETLRRMGRRYDSDFFIERVERIRAGIPDVGITTDVIVGFPGEKAKHFDETMRVAELANFSKIHVFRFSPRPGTKAVGMKPRVAQGEISRRARRLIALGDEMGLSFRQRFVGQVLPVLIEGRAGEGDYLAGFSSNYIRIKIPGASADNVNKVQSVRLTDAWGHCGVAEGCLEGSST